MLSMKIEILIITEWNRIILFLLSTAHKAHVRTATSTWGQPSQNNVVNVIATDLYNIRGFMFFHYTYADVDKPGHMEQANYIDGYRFFICRANQQVV